MATAILKDGNKRHYTIKLNDIGYGRTWDDVEYSDFKQATANILNIGVEDLERAYL